MAIDTARQTLEECLAASDAAFAAGEHDAGSELLYQAATTAMSQLADAYGQPCGTWEELHDFAQRLDDKRGSDGRYAMNLRTAQTYHHTAKYHFIPPDELELCRPLMHEFVAELLSYQRKGATR